MTTLRIDEIPDALEDVVLRRGPVVLSILVEDAGGPVKAASICGMSATSLLEWLDWTPGRVFGARRRDVAYRSLWIGYPPPFPALDRVVELRSEREGGFLRAWCLRHTHADVPTALDVLRSERFGLSDIVGSKSEMYDLCRSIGVPPATASRLWSACRYPEQWKKLDRLAVSRGFSGWLDAVLNMPSIRMMRVREKVPDAAILAMMETSGSMP